MATKAVTNPEANASATLWLWRKWRARRRRVQQRYLSQGRFVLTREGFHFLALLLFTFVGALIREINLLILLAGCMIGLLLLQWRFNTRTLRGLTVARRLPSSTVVGSPFRVSLDVDNPKRLLGSWLVMVEDRLARTSPYPKKLTEQGMAVLDAVPPRTHRTCEYELTIHERGAYEIGPSTISTRFPLGLGRGWRTLSNERRLIVRPKQGDLKPAARALFQQLRVGHAASSPKPGTHEAEFYGLRRWQSGDSKRWIHWRTTARVGEISVRQFERQQHRQLNVLLDLHLPTSGDLQWCRSLCELVISFVATLATKTAHSSTDSLSVSVAGKQQFSMIDARSPVLVNNLLDQLAVVEPTDEPDLQEAFRSLKVSLISNPQLLVISTRANQLARLVGDASSDSSHARFLSRLAITWLNASEDHLEPYFLWTSN
jgi:uncharacterized protein (DUF58 family)